MPPEEQRGLNPKDQRLIELVKEFQEGKRSAFDKIFSLAYPNVYFMVYKMMRDHYEAEDVTQEIFTHVFKSLASLKEPQTFKKWMNQIVWHTTLDYLKSKRRNSTTGCGMETFTGAELRIGYSDDAGSQILEAERKNAVMGAVNQLNPMLRATVLLRFFNDLKEREIAEVMNVPLGTVKRRLMIAKQQLSGKLTGIYSVFPYFFVRLSAIKECKETLGVLKVAAPAALFGRAALVTGLTAGAVATAVVQGPEVKDLKYNGRKGYVNEQRVQWKIDSALPIKSIRFLEKTGKIEEEDGKYWADITENGTYTLCVADICGQETVRQIQIDNIDAESPIYCSYTEDGNRIVLRFHDSSSGINWREAKFFCMDGRDISETAIHKEKGEAHLPLNAFPLCAKIEDFAGNYSIYRLELKDMQVGERTEEENESA